MNIGQQLPNYYEILGVPQDASPVEIKKAFRTLSLKLHPDKQGGNEDDFKRINEAYTILSDQDKKNAYDMNFNRSKSFNNSHQQFPNVNLNDIFGELLKNDVFGNIIKVNLEKVAKNIGITKPVPIIKTIELSLKQSYEGCNYPLIIERFNVDDPEKPDDKTYETETIYINIPAGIDNNEIIVINGKGNAISKNYGDIKCFIKINNETNFIRNGLDLIFKKELSLKEALCGFTFPLEHLDGRTYNINNSVGKIISPGMKQIIQKMGMKRQGAVNGNLIIEFEIKFPELLTTDQRDIILKTL